MSRPIPPGSSGSPSPEENKSGSSDDVHEQTTVVADTRGLFANEVTEVSTPSKEMPRKDTLLFEVFDPKANPFQTRSKRSNSSSATSAKRTSVVDDSGLDLAVSESSHTHDSLDSIQMRPLIGGTAFTSNNDLETTVPNGQFNSAPRSKWLSPLLLAVTFLTAVIVAALRFLNLGT